MRCGGRWIPVCGVLAIAAGFGVVLTHGTTPGARGAVVPVLTPAWRAALGLPAEGPALVVAAHPQCPCLPATMASLRAIRRDHPEVPLRLLVCTPAVTPAAWRPEFAAALREEFGRDAVRDDAEAALAVALGCRTSGHVLVYDARSRLVFDGGVTAGRGHEGPCAAAAACARALVGGAIREITHVYGCPLQPDTGAHGECCRRP